MLKNSLAGLHCSAMLVARLEYRSAKLLHAKPIYDEINLSLHSFCIRSKTLEQKRRGSIACFENTECQVISMLISSLRHAEIESRTKLKDWC